ICFPEHTHSEYNLLVCLEGSIRVTQAGVSEMLQPGDILLGNSGLPHTSEYAVGGTRTEAISVTVSDTVFLQMLRKSGVLRWQESTRPAFLGRIHDEALLQLAISASEELDNQTGGFDIVLDSLSTQMLIRMIRLWPRSGIEKGAVNVKPQLPRWQFVKALEYMHVCGKEQFNIPDLARRLGSSPVRLNRLFRESAGITPARFYNNIISERAAGLISETDCSIKEIGFKLGFKTQSHFCETFRQLTGSSPAAYRQHGRAGLAALLPTSESD
ncbi:MAG: AraC family transcriptional regulator, partial [Bryobacteraceae bacterium]|nr:AraC family transcriptional regulator [Bryobacteraceae bacterium]